jgi:hypothetical protein
MGRRRSQAEALEGRRTRTNASPNESWAICRVFARLAARASGARAGAFFGGGAAATGAGWLCAALYWAAVWRPPPESTVFRIVLSNLSSMRPRPLVASASICAFRSSKAFWSASRSRVSRAARPPALFPSTVLMFVPGRAKSRCDIVPRWRYAVALIAGGVWQSQLSGGAIPALTKPTEYVRERRASVRRRYLINAYSQF